MSKKKKERISEVTVLEEQGDEKIVARFETDSEGNVIIGIDLEEIVKSMNIDSIVAQPIIEKYESMFATVILDKGTKDLWQHAFFDVYLYALALKAEKGEENE